MCSAWYSSRFRWHDSFERNAPVGKTTIDRLIVNSPYEEPGQHWTYERETRLFDLAEGQCAGS